MPGWIPSGPNHMLIARKMPPGAPISQSALQLKKQEAIFQHVEGIIIDSVVFLRDFSDFAREADKPLLRTPAQIILKQVELASNNPGVSRKDLLERFKEPLTMAPACIDEASDPKLKQRNSTEIAERAKSTVENRDQTTNMSEKEDIVESTTENNKPGTTSKEIDAESTGSDERTGWL